MAKDASAIEIPLTTKSILIIADDNNRDANFIRVALKDIGYSSINSLASAKEAVELLESRVGDILYVNLENKFLPGVNVVRRIKENPKTRHIPVFLSAYSSDRKSIALAGEIGVERFLVKPLTQKSIIEQLESAGKKRMKELYRWRKEQEKAIVKRDLDLVSEQAEKKNLYMEAIERIRLLQASFPWNDEIYIELGKMLMRLGFDDQAVTFLQHAAKLSTKSPKPLGLMSDILAEKGEYKKAVKFAKAAATLTGSPRAHSKLGELQQKGGMLNDAIKTFSYVLMRIESDEEMAAKQKHVLSSGYNLRGQAYLEKGEKEKSTSFMNRAVNDFEQSAKINPDFIAANYNLMVTYKKMGEKNKALAVLDRIKKMEPEDADGWIQLAGAYFNDGDTGKVSFALEKALSYKKGDLSYHKKIAELYMEYGMFDKAVPLLQTASNALPDDVFFYNRLGIIYRRQRKLDEAIKQYEKALKLDPDDATIYFNLGRAYLDSGNTEGAEKMFKKSMEIDPELDAAKHFLEDYTSEPL